MVVFFNRFLFLTLQFIIVCHSFLSTLMAVSYTHLDVYKRQALHTTSMHDEKLILFKIMSLQFSLQLFVLFWINKIHYRRKRFLITKISKDREFKTNPHILSYSLFFQLNSGEWIFVFLMLLIIHIIQKF